MQDDETAAERADTPRSLEPLRESAIWFLRLFAVAASLYALLDLYLYVLIGVGVYDETGPLGFAEAVLGLIYTVIEIVCIVIVARWIYRAMRNLRRCGIHTEMSPGWAVGWYFIPVASLWKPYQGMREIWQASLGAHGQDAQVPVIMRWWWAAWVVFGVVSSVSLRMYLAADPAIVRASYLTGAVADIAGVASAILLAGLIQRVSILQARLVFL